MLGALPPELDEFIRNEVASGRYESPQAVICDALRLLKERELERERFLREIQLGLEQLDRGESTEYDEDGLRGLFEELKAGIRKAS